MAADDDDDVLLSAMAADEDDDDDDDDALVSTAANHDDDGDDDALLSATADDDDDALLSATGVDETTPPSRPPVLVQSLPPPPSFRPALTTLTPPADTDSDINIDTDTDSDTQIDTDTDSYVNANADPAWRAPLVALAQPPMDSRSTAAECRPARVDTAAAECRPRQVDSATADCRPAQADTAPPPPSEYPIAWIDGALDVLLKNVRGCAVPNNPLRILSHALPVPSDTGHIYHTILDRIGANTPSHPPTWITLFHAIPGRFNLPDMPTSPPSTPVPPASANEDYFTQKIFSSAVPISDYQDDLSALPRSPRPVLPPATVNLSVVERYIPPSSTHEFKSMFDPSGPSLLVDRLAELSPAGGTLVFIYPTRTGATTFLQDYLGPILDPLLRTIMVVNGLSATLSHELGTMAAAKDLQEFEPMRKSMEALCTTLAQRNRGRYATVYASTAKVRLARTAWAKDWWPKQEYSRIREMVTRATQEAQKKTSNRYNERTSTPTELVGRLVEGVLKKAYPSGQEPTSDIEVSVFMIQRSALAE